MSAVTLGPDEKYQIAVAYGTIISTGVLAIVVCSLRLYVRKFMVNAFGIDDWACLGGLIAVTMFNGIGIAVVYYGCGKHIEHVSASDLQMWYLLYYVCSCSYLFISFAVKSSVLIFIRRVFPTGYIQNITLGLLIFITLFTISGSFVAAFQCNPPKYAYDLTYLMSPDRASHCFSADTSYAIFMYQAVTIFFCDIVTLILPIPALLELKVSRSKSVALLVIFGSGIVACVAPAVRFSSLQFYKSGSADTTYLGTPSLYWMAIEYNLGLVAGSLSSLRPLFIRFGLFGSTHEASYMSKTNQFAPSYQLDDRSNTKWGSKASASKSKSTTESALDITMVGDDSDQNSEEMRIVKTEDFTITEEYHQESSLHQEVTAWGELRESKYM